MTTLRRPITSFVVAATLLATACGGASPAPGPTTTPPPEPTATTTATTTTSPTGTRTPAASPSPSAPPPSAPTATGGGPVSSATPPAGYASSCARDVPWGRQVTKPFVCLERPVAGTRVARGGSVTIVGYAGGSFESNVVNEVRALVDREPGARLAMTPVTYDAPDIGMPGTWRVTLTIPTSAPAGAARVIAHFDSPRDGSVVAQATVDIVIE